MANLREIRSRIAGVKSTSKITQAMKMVASAKLRRAQDAIVATRPYAYSLRDLMGHLLGKVDRNTLPLMMDRPEVGGVLLVVVTADRGLCGAFNNNIIKHAVEKIETEYSDLNAQGNVKLLCIGRRGASFFKKHDYNVIDSHIGIVNSAGFMDAKHIMDSIIEGYLNNEYDRVEFIYNEFKSVIQQTLRMERILPLPEEDVVKTEGQRYHEFVDYIYEPSEVELMEYLIPEHLDYQMYRVLLESNAAEQGARRTAMDAATSNALDLIDSLQLTYNSARQANITKEILEIVGGAEALRESS